MLYYKQVLSDQCRTVSVQAWRTIVVYEVSAMKKCVDSSFSLNGYEPAPNNANLPNTKLVTSPLGRPMNMHRVYKPKGTNKGYYVILQH